MRGMYSEGTPLTVYCFERREKQLLWLCVVLNRSRHRTGEGSLFVRVARLSYASAPCISRVAGLPGKAQANCRHADALLSGPQAASVLPGAAPPGWRARRRWFLSRCCLRWPAAEAALWPETRRPACFPFRRARRPLTPTAPAATTDPRSCSAQAAPAREP